MWTEGNVDVRGACEKLCVYLFLGSFRACFFFFAGNPSVFASQGALLFAFFFLLLGRAMVPCLHLSIALVTFPTCVWTGHPPTSTMVSTAAFTLLHVSRLHLTTHVFSCVDASTSRSTFQFAALSVVSPNRCRICFCMAEHKLFGWHSRRPLACFQRRRTSRYRFLTRTIRRRACCTSFRLDEGECGGDVRACTSTCRLEFLLSWRAGVFLPGGTPSPFLAGGRDNVDVEERWNKSVEGRDVPRGDVDADGSNGMDE